MEENKDKGTPKRENPIKFNIINFSEVYVPPVNTYNKSRGFVTWGKDNLYPNYIMDLYNHYGSTIFKNIINKKCKLVAGKGFKEILDPKLLEFVKANELEKELRKAEVDYELFNGFALEVIYNNAGTDVTSLKHLPFANLRVGIEDEDLNFPHYLYSRDWKHYRKAEYEPEILRAYNPLIKKGKQVYYHVEYNPQADVYPIVEYSNSINWIELEYEISKFHLNQAKLGYFGSTILNLSSGIPTEEEMDEFSKDFQRNYMGTENAGKMLITYSEGADGAPVLVPVELNDSDDRFIHLMQDIENKIVSGAEIPMPLVVLTEGKLGNTSDRAELMEEFQQSYVTPRQTVLEEALNGILAFAYKEELKLETYIDEDREFKEMRKKDGAVMEILSIHQSVLAGLTSRDVAKSVLEMFYGFNEEEVERLIGKEITNTNNEE